MKTFKFSLTGKLLLLSMAILGIPYIGFEFLREMERYLRDSLEISLADAAHTIANTLQGGVSLFPDRPRTASGTLYVHKLNLPVQLDGYTDDWDAYLDWSDVFRDQSSGPLSFRLIVSSYGQYYYVLIRVHDNRIIYQETASPTSISNDHVILVVSDPAGRINNYYFSPAAPGSIRPFRFQNHADEFDFSYRTVEYAANITGQFQPSDDGYNLEIAIPMNMAGEYLGFIINDIDDPQDRNIIQSLGTAGSKTRERPGALLLPSGEIYRIIEGLGYSDGRRVWVLDNQGQVLASTGSLDKSISEQDINIIYRLILPPVNERFQDDLEGASRLQGEEVLQALSGYPETRWRASPDGKTIIVSAAAPVMINNVIKGVVVVEETTNNIQMLRRQAMTTLFNKTFIIFTFVTMLLLIFAGRLSYRLRKLSNQVNTSIDEQGRFVKTFTASKASDEIGDLSRNYTAMLDRLRQYHDYLEGMSARLSHELRTPIAVVQSSLEHLQSSDTDDNSLVYLERAREGIKRLNLIVSRLSEAARLELSLKTVKKESTDCRRLLSDCIDGYRLAFPSQTFNLSLPEQACIKDVAPDLIIQMMDKLVNNAIDFSSAGTPIDVSLVAENKSWLIQVINYGSSLPEVMNEQLFNSMVSVRKKKGGKEPHLGMGLYMVRLIAEFHGGTVNAWNLIDKQGVEFIINFGR